MNILFVTEVEIILLLELVVMVPITLTIEPGMVLIF